MLNTDQLYQNLINNHLNKYPMSAASMSRYTTGFSHRLSLKNLWQYAFNILILNYLATSVLIISLNFHLFSSIFSE